MVPLRERPQLPEGYGVPTGDEGLLPWSWAEARLTAAANFWFSTTRPDGRPHAVPAWGIWLDEALYFEGSPATRRARNLVHNPALVVHLEDGTQVLILEGEAAPAHPPTSALAERLAAEFGRKYGPTHDYRPSPDQWNAGGGAVGDAPARRVWLGPLPDWPDPLALLRCEGLDRFGWGCSCQLAEKVDRPQKGGSGR